MEERKVKQMVGTKQSCLIRITQFCEGFSGNVLFVYTSFCLYCERMMKSLQFHCYSFFSCQICHEGLFGTWNMNPLNQPQ